MVHLAGFSQLSELTVVITGNENTRGKIRIGVFSNADDFKSKTNPVDSASVALNQGRVSYTFHKLPASTYAIAVYHDENNDSTLNKRQMGIPVEGIGFSNYTEFKHKPPNFDEVAFELGNEDLTLEIPLFYKKK